MVKEAVKPLQVQAQEDIEFSWVSFANRIRTVIKEYGKMSMADCRQMVQWARLYKQWMDETSHYR